MDDIKEACDLLRPVWERTNGVDGFVSLEVDPRLAYDRERSVRAGSAVQQEVDRPNLYVKIPATEPGLGAIEDCIAKGVPINVTLIFSLERYAAVAEAYLRGARAARRGRRRPAQGDLRRELLRLARRHRGRQAAGGGRPAGPAGKARDREREARLPALSRGRAAATAGRSSPAKGARPQRCLWASTSAKNPAYRDVIYVEELIGPDTVNTMPLETVRAFQDHGEVKAGSLAQGIDEAKRLLADLAAAGVDYDDVVATLEAEGVEKFADSFAELLEGIRAKVGTLAPA